MEWIILAFVGIIFINILHCKFGKGKVISYRDVESESTTWMKNYSSQTLDPHYDSVPGNAGYKGNPFVDWDK